MKTSPRAGSRCLLCSGDRHCSAAYSGSQVLRAPGTHTLQPAGPQRAVQQVGAHYETSGGSGSVTLSLNPEDFDAGQIWGFQLHVGQTLLQGWGSLHVPVAVAADSMLDRSLQIDA